MARCECRGTRARGQARTAAWCCDVRVTVRLARLQPWRMGEQRGRAGAAAEELCGFGVDSSEAQWVFAKENRTELQGEESEQGAGFLKK